MLGHLDIGLLKERNVTEEVHKLPEAGDEIIGGKIPEKLYVGILSPEKVLRQQAADGDLPERPGNLNLVQVDILMGQTVYGLTQGYPAGMVLGVGVHVEEEVLPLTELVFRGSLDKICKMCEFMEENKADIIFIVQVKAWIQVEDINASQQFKKVETALDILRRIITYIRDHRIAVHLILFFIKLP